MERINVTKTFLPPIEEYEAYLKQIWSSAYLTNQGPLLLEFENRVQKYLGVNNFHFVTNGTLALQLALRALDITGGEVITTPFSYVATVSAILWERCEPVFADIDPETFCIDASKIEALINNKTKAIVAVHVFGHPCEVERIEDIAKKHDLKVIYDAAHAFGVEYNGKSLIKQGDISICSFHATKLFHTIEGGGVVTDNKILSGEIELLKRFGHNLDEHYKLGINAKASEFQAAMGLCNLEHIDNIIAERKKLSELYDRWLDNKFQRPVLGGQTKYNYGYYPILAQNEKQLLAIIAKLNAKNIFPRRYFYPSLNTLPYLKESINCQISEDVASRILCLPLYVDLKETIIKQICEDINRL